MGEEKGKEEILNEKRDEGEEMMGQENEVIEEKRGKGKKKEKRI
jgi:hypothetical protein